VKTNAPPGEGGAAAAQTQNGTAEPSRCAPDPQADVALRGSITRLAIFSFACGFWSGGLIAWFGAAFRACRP